ncbi:hypothetical protein M2360_004873 [Rhizobium sp. SG_E_25_P2]|uniref:hypothetical protein n=1 Tax=Rhizobium sp. SG_E_25_P2 TaxID=2879942 RepID=UPI002475DC50|nr:hypothetical protein [Rhizobium sp. SG_E_25_P2]MDH6269445.1 hypothetical protein [Rhizobium sp. SG_E_25_P2]
MSDFIAALIAFFVIDPLTAELDGKLAGLKSSPETAAIVRECAGAIGPQLIEKASGDYWWAATTAFSVATGLTAPESLLADGPACCQTALSLMKGETGKEAGEV